MRVVKKGYKGNTYYTIFEIWYDADGTIDGWIDDYSPVGETVAGLKKELENIKKATLKEPLDYDELTTSPAHKDRIERVDKSTARVRKVFNKS
jgi:hypothetical protein